MAEHVVHCASTRHRQYVPINTICINNCIRLSNRFHCHTVAVDSFVNTKCVRPPACHCSFFFPPDSFSHFNLMWQRDIWAFECRICAYFKRRLYFSASVQWFVHFVACCVVHDVKCAWIYSFRFTYILIINWLFTVIVYRQIFTNWRFDCVKCNTSTIT